MPQAYDAATPNLAVGIVRIVSLAHVGAIVRNAREDAGCVGSELAPYRSRLMPHILLISGSLRAGSTNTATIRTAQQLAPVGVTVEVYEAMGSLPHFNPDDDQEGEVVDAAVADLRANITAADGVMICTPEYAGALPGSLKNLLEWTVGDGGTYGKPVAWINLSGPAAPTGGADAHDSLRKVLGYVHANIVESACLRLPLTRDAVADDGTINDPASRREISTALSLLIEAATD